MPRTAYVEKCFARRTLVVVQQANQIISEYQEQGYDLTLRQLYYQFVARDLIANTQRDYKRLGSIINDARLAGLIDWNALVDRTRNLEGNAHWESPEELIASAAKQFKLDKWEDQPNRVEVWVEKEALAGVIERTCRRLDIDWFSCRGYVSQSEMWSAAQRHIRYEDGGQSVVVLHLGDHDPSGIDMSRDIQDRLELFDAGTEVRRIALNMDQIQAYDPPPNPAKLTDSRIVGYVERFGRSSWELDALDPRVLDQLVTREVEALRKNGLFNDRALEEDNERSLLLAISENMPRVREMLIS